MTRLRPAILVACLALALAGCKDPRRDLAQAHVLANPPAGFEIATPPKSIPIVDGNDGGGSAVISVRYRLVHSTIEMRDGFTLPRIREVAAQLAAFRGWALGALPAGHPTRESILEAVARARTAFPVKHIVTPAGTEVDALVTLQMHKSSAGTWKVTSYKVDVGVPGVVDSTPSIPFEDSPEVIARFEQLTATLQELEASRRDYLAERDRIAAQSLAKLRLQLRTGRTFNGQLPSGPPLRIVISRGLENDGSAAAVLTIRSGEESTARFSGSLVQQPSGATVWRAAQLTRLSPPAGQSPPAATDAASHPVLTLSATDTGLTGQLEIQGEPPAPLSLHAGEPADLIPEPAPSPSDQ